MIRQGDVVYENSEPVAWFMRGSWYVLVPHRRTKRLELVPCHPRMTSVYDRPAPSAWELMYGLDKLGVIGPWRRGVHAGKVPR